MYLSPKKMFDIDRPNIRLFLIIFFTTVMAKGLVIFRGYSIDDYGLMPADGTIDFGLFFSQGRYITAAIVWFIQSIGANISDMYFSMGITALFLQTVFLVSIIRFAGLEKSPKAGIVGAIIAAHPYLTEIFTFKAALPFYSVALFFAIVALEMALISPATWRTRASSLVATIAMLFTYQVFINYFAVAIIFAFAFGQVSNIKNGYSLATNNIFRQRAVALALISFVAIFIFSIIIWLTKFFGMTSGLSISKILTIDEIPNRLTQISSSLVNIYWSSEPVFSGKLKLLVALMLALSLARIFIYFLRGNDATNSIRSVFVTAFSFLLLIPVSFGVILPFEVWWPVPRVIAHVSVIIGFIFLLADSCIPASENRLVRSTFLIARGIILVGFIFSSNQILIDQQRINQWDTLMANRIIARLEMHPDYNKVKFVYISKGSWPWPYTAKLRTTEGDMNVSAFLVEYTKVPLLSEISGFDFKSATGSKVAFGESYCKVKQPWPHIESIAVDNDVAIICLKN